MPPLSEFDAYQSRISQLLSKPSLIEAFDAAEPLRRAASRDILAEANKSLVIAVNAIRPQGIALALVAGADPELRIDDEKWSVLAKCAWGGAPRLVELLLHAGARTDRVDVWGKTALMRAAENNQMACLQLLLPVSDPAARTPNGSQALAWAAALGRHEICAILAPLSDVSSKDDKGRDASDLAEINGHHSLAAWLRNFQLALTQEAAIEEAFGAASKSLPRRL